MTLMWSYKTEPVTLVNNESIISQPCISITLPKLLTSNLVVIWPILPKTKLIVGGMDFKVDDPGNTEKNYRPLWLTNKKNVWILDALEWLK